jgi:tRNA threonylcarbamoyladenosine biosynthesis protein TsaE
MELIHVESLSELDSAAEQIIANLSPNRIMCFYGSMGAGKTTLIKSICKVLGVTDTVVSPTFALIYEYTTAKGIPVYHFDFYRINKVEEVYDFGYEEYFYSDTGVCLIEWPELIEDLLPTEGVVRYKIDVNPDNSRTITEID